MPPPPSAFRQARWSPFYTMSAPASDCRYATFNAMRMLRRAGHSQAPDCRCTDETIDASRAFYYLSMPGSYNITPAPLDALLQLAASREFCPQAMRCRLGAGEDAERMAYQPERS